MLRDKKNLLNSKCEVNPGKVFLFSSIFCAQNFLVIFCKKRYVCDILFCAKCYDQKNGAQFESLLKKQKAKKSGDN